MNILVIYDGYREVAPIGGIPSFIYFLAKTTFELGHDVTILERQGPGAEKAEENIYGVRYIRLKVKKRAQGANEVLFNFPFNLIRVVLDGITWAAKANRWIRNHNGEYDIIHFHLPLASTLFTLVNPKLRSRMVYTFHGDNYRVNLNSRVTVPWYVRLFSPDLMLMRRVKKVVALNTSIYSSLLASGKLPPGRLANIGIGVNTKVYNPEIATENVRSEYEMEGRTVILFAGVIFARKGIEYLIKAAGILAEKSENRNLLFLLAGTLDVDKEYVGRMVGLIDALGLKENVKLLGSVPHSKLISLYASCDLLVCPSPEEAFPAVVLEAMSCGKPVIGTSVGGMLDEIVDGQTGLLCNPEDEKDLAEKIQYLLNHPDERKKMGENSRRRALEVFDWQKVAEKYLELYMEIIS